jgi:hypothetical protein
VYRIRARLSAVPEDFPQFNFFALQAQLTAPAARKTAM